MEAHNPYAAPQAQPAAPCLPELRRRFWATCVAFSFTGPAFLCAWAAISEWFRVLMLFVFWSVGAFWIVLPHLRHENRAELDLTYLACQVVGFPFCTGLIFLGMSALVGGIVVAVMV